MLQDLEELTAKTVPQSIRLTKAMNLPQKVDEYRMLSELGEIAAENEVWKSYIGMGYYGCITPPAIQRNMLESAGWYVELIDCLLFDIIHNLVGT